VVTRHSSFTTIRILQALHMTERFRAWYLLETSHDVGLVAEILAGEQSTAKGVRLPGDTGDEIHERYGARIESIELLDESARPSLPSREQGGGVCRRAEVCLSWPVHNVGASLPILWVTLLGNQVGMRQLSGIRLRRLELPASFVRGCPLPQFGIHGTRRLTGVYGRPLIGCIVKPNIGLTPEQTAGAVRELAASGIDFIKDDELIASPPYSPLAARVAAVMPVIDEIAQGTGRKVMYAFNITDEYDQMLRHHDTVLAAGGTCVMVDINGVGLSGLASLRRHCQLPIHGHRAGWAMFTRSPALGMDFQPYQAIHRLAGVDHLHVSGLGGKFWEDFDTVLSSARHCLTPLSSGPGRDDRAMPVFSGGSTIHQAAPTFHGAGTADLIYTCGTGIMGHPVDLASGCRSMRQAWEAALQGIPLRHYAKTHPELAAALSGRRDPVH